VGSAGETLEDAAARREVGRTVMEREQGDPAVSLLLWASGLSTIQLLVINQSRGGDPPTPGDR
jgi:hypothetical protein